MSRRVTKNIFYRHYHDKMISKRSNSPYKARRLVHDDMFKAILRNLPETTSRVADVGCGEGLLTYKIAQEASCEVKGIDYSAANVASAREKFSKIENLCFLEGDALSTNFPDSSFDLVVSNHVLEHLDDFDEGIKELKRISSRYVILAVPTCFSLLSIMLLGGSNYWRPEKRSLLAPFVGMLRILKALFLRADGVDEGYGDGKQPHVFRFPWVVEKSIKDAGLKIIKVDHQAIRLPYIGVDMSFLCSVHSWFKFCGMGTVWVCQKR